MTLVVEYKYWIYVLSTKLGWFLLKSDKDNGYVDGFLDGSDKN